MARGLILLSDRQLAEHEGFLLDIANSLHDKKVNGLAVVALLDEDYPDTGDILTGYFHMSIRDRQLAAASIQTDSMYRMLRIMLDSRSDTDQVDEDEEE